MKIMNSKHIEDCFDGSYIYELSLSEPITEPLMTCLGVGSTLQCFPDFPRPYFRVLDCNFTLKGIEGNQTLRVIAFEPIEKTLDTLFSRIQQFTQS